MGGRYLSSLVVKFAALWRYSGHGRRARIPGRRERYHAPFQIDAADTPCQSTSAGTGSRGRPARKRPRSERTPIGSMLPAAARHLPRRSCWLHDAVDRGRCSSWLTIARNCSIPPIIDGNVEGVCGITMPCRSRRAIVTVLLAVWFVWAFVSLSATIHFLVVVHAVDPVTAEVVHPHPPTCSHHQGHERAEGGRASDTNEWHDRDRPGEWETCTLLSTAQHASSVLLALPSMATSPRIGLVPPSEPRVRGERDIGLLALAPKLPPPHSCRPSPRR